MKHGLEIEDWAFWSPESREPAQWRSYWTQTDARPQQTKPPGDAIPAIHRRRMSSLSKAAVQVALEATRKIKPDGLVFCSQHGELARTRELLADIVGGVELSPTAFSQSVHNTSAGLFTIVTQSRAPASSIASGASTFAYGWIESEGFLVENPESRALLVSYDEALPTEYSPYAKQTQCSYAVALMLRLSPDNGAILETADGAAEEVLPLAPLFMAWWLSSAATLSATADGQGWLWRRRVSATRQLVD